MTVNSAIVFTFAAVLLLVQEGKAEELLPVVHTMERVEAILTNNHYAAKGYAKTEPPFVILVDRLPLNHWGEYLAGVVKISRAQPLDCVPVTLSHELAHDATVKFKLAKDKDEAEQIARLVESHVASDGVWLPGCISTKE